MQNIAETARVSKSAKPPLRSVEGADATLIELLTQLRLVGVICPTRSDQTPPGDPAPAMLNIQGVPYRSAPMIVKPPVVVSWPCMILSASSSLMPGRFVPRPGPSGAAAEPIGAEGQSLVSQSLVDSRSLALNATAAIGAPLLAASFRLRVSFELAS